MSKKNETNTPDSLENVENALGRTEQFIENNQKVITAIAMAIIILVGGYWGIKKLYIAPKAVDANKEMFAAQSYFEQDSFQLALNGDGINKGFLEIIDDYGIVKPGNLAKYYAGLSYLHLKQYEDAIEYLEGFSAKEENVMAGKYGATGDAYLELGNTDEALANYKKAAEYTSDITAPFYLMKLGLLYEQIGDKESAVKAYEIIKDEYSQSTEARQIEKYITRATIGE